MIISTEPQKISHPEDIVKILRSILAHEDTLDQDKEHFWTIGLRSSNVISYIELVSLGSLTASIVEPRETFRLAIQKGVNSIIIAHNHPSNDTTISDSDRKITMRLKEAGHILGIELLDHIIVTASRHVSFKENGLCGF